MTEPSTFVLEMPSSEDQNRFDTLQSNLRTFTEKLTECGVHSCKVYTEPTCFQFRIAGNMIGHDLLIDFRPDDTGNIYHIQIGNKNFIDSPDWFESIGIILKYLRYEFAIGDWTETDTTFIIPITGLS